MRRQGLLIILIIFLISNSILIFSKDREVVSQEALNLLKAGDELVLSVEDNPEKADELYDSAKNNYDKAIEIEETFAEAYNNRGFVYEKKGNDTEAKSDYNTAYEYEKTNPKILYNNALIQYREGTVDEQTEEDLSKAFKLVSQSDIYSDTLKISISILLTNIYLEEFLQDNITGTLDALYGDKQPEIKEYFKTSENIETIAVYGYINHQLNRPVTGLNLYNRALEKLDKISDKTLKEKKLEARLYYNKACLSMLSNKRQTAIDSLNTCLEKSKEVALAEKKLDFIKSLFDNIDDDTDLSYLEFEVEHQNIIDDYDKFVNEFTE